MDPLPQHVPGNPGDYVTLHVGVTDDITARARKNLDKIKIPKAFILRDPHHEPSEKIDYIGRVKKKKNLLAVN